MLSRTCLRAIFLLALCSGLAHAAPGVNLRWDRCFGDAGVQFRDFACDTNTGAEQLVGSFVLPSDLAGVTGVEVFVSIGSQSPTLPAWWQFFNAGSCRGSALTTTLTPPAGSSACVDWAAGESAGGLSTYIVGDYQGPNHVRLKLGVASAFVRTLVAGQEYFLFVLNLRHQKTIGTGACAGCLEPVVIFFSGAIVVPGMNPSIRLMTGTAGDDTRWASWQQGYPTNISPTGCFTSCGGMCCTNLINTFDVVTTPPTGTRGSTWGAVKSLYR